MNPHQAMIKQHHAVFLLSCLAWSITTALSVPGDPWKAPPQADQLTDPLAGDPKAVQRGGKVFTSLCWVCHGMEGRGDGPTAASLQVRPADLVASTVQQQSNGALYWKIGHGRGEMPAYEEMLSREDRWAVVHYLRSLVP